MTARYRVTADVACLTIASVRNDLDRALVWDSLYAGEREAITQAINSLEKAMLTLRIAGRRSNRGALAQDAQS